MDSYEAPKCPALPGRPSRPGATAGPRWRRDAGWHFFLGELADLGESIKPLDLYRCEKCGRLEFYDQDFSLPEA